MLGISAVYLLQWEQLKATFPPVHLHFIQISQILISSYSDCFLILAMVRLELLKRPLEGVLHTNCVFKRFFSSCSYFCFQ